MTSERKPADPSAALTLITLGRIEGKIDTHHAAHGRALDHLIQTLQRYSHGQFHKPSAGPKEEPDPKPAGRRPRSPLTATPAMGTASSASTGGSTGTDRQELAQVARTARKFGLRALKAAMATLAKWIGTHYLLPILLGLLALAWHWLGRFWGVLSGLL